MATIDVSRLVAPEFWVQQNGIYYKSLGRPLLQSDVSGSMFNNEYKLLRGHGKRSEFLDFDAAYFCIVDDVVVYASAFIKEHINYATYDERSCAYEGEDHIAVVMTPCSKTEVSVINILFPDSSITSCFGQVLLRWQSVKYYFVVPSEAQNHGVDCQVVDDKNEYRATKRVSLKSTLNYIVLEVSFQSNMETLKYFDESQWEAQIPGSCFLKHRNPNVVFVNDVNAFWTPTCWIIVLKRTQHRTEFQYSAWQHINSTCLWKLKIAANKTYELQKTTIQTQTNVTQPASPASSTSTTLSTSPTSPTPSTTTTTPTLPPSPTHPTTPTLSTSPPRPNTSNNPNTFNNPNTPPTSPVSQTLSTSPPSPTSPVSQTLSTSPPSPTSPVSQTLSTSSKRPTATTSEQVAKRVAATLIEAVKQGKRATSETTQPSGDASKTTNTPHNRQIVEMILDVLCPTNTDRKYVTMECITRNEETVCKLISSLKDGTNCRSWKDGIALFRSALEACCGLMLRTDSKGKRPHTKILGYYFEPHYNLARKANTIKRSRDEDVTRNINVTVVDEEDGKTEGHSKVPFNPIHDEYKFGVDYVCYMDINSRQRVTECLFYDRHGMLLSDHALRVNSTEFICMKSGEIIYRNQTKLCLFWCTNDGDGKVVHAPGKIVNWNINPDNSVEIQIQLLQHDRNNVKRLKLQNCFSAETHWLPLKPTFRCQLSHVSLVQQEQLVTDYVATCKAYNHLDKHDILCRWSEDVHVVANDRLVDMHDILEFYHIPSKWIWRSSVGQYIWHNFIHCVIDISNRCNVDFASHVMSTSTFTSQILHSERTVCDACGETGRVKYEIQMNQKSYNVSKMCFSRMTYLFNIARHVREFRTCGYLNTDALQTLIPFIVELYATFRNNKSS